MLLHVFHCEHAHLFARTFHAFRRRIQREKEKVEAASISDLFLASYLVWTEYDRLDIRKHGDKHSDQRDAVQKLNHRARCFLS